MSGILGKRGAVALRRIRPAVFNQNHVSSSIPANQSFGLVAWLFATCDYPARRRSVLHRSEGAGHDMTKQHSVVSIPFIGFSWEDCGSLQTAVLPPIRISYVADSWGVGEIFNRGTVD
jgi:hypothetical protein